jgi:hypothetical protein
VSFFLKKSKLLQAPRLTASKVMANARAMRLRCFWAKSSGREFMLGLVSDPAGRPSWQPPTRAGVNEKTRIRQAITQTFGLD